MKHQDTIVINATEQEKGSEAIAFAEWVRDNDVYPCGDSWHYDGVYHTTEHLYSIFKQSKQ